MSTQYIPRDAYEQEIIGAQQQAETARKLREGIIAPQGQMIGNQFVAPSITQHLANILKSYSAGRQERDSAQAIKDAQAAQAQKEQAYIAGIPSPTVTPAVVARTAPVFEDSASRLAKVLTQGAQPSTPTNLSPTQDNADAMQPSSIAEALRARSNQYSIPVQAGTQDIPAQPEKITQPGIEDYLKYAMNAPNDKTAAMVQLLGVNRQNAVDKQDAFKAAAELKRETMAQQNEAKKQHDADVAAQQQIAREQMFAQQESMARLAASLKNQGGEPAPKASPGTRVYKDENGAWKTEILQGSPQWQTQKSKEATDRAFVQNIVPQNIKNMEQIDGLIGSKGFNSIFGLSSYTPNIMPAARDAKAKLDQVVGAMETAGMQLQKSTAGSAGAMSEKEWPKMQTYLNLVKTASSPEAAKEALLAARQSYQRMVDVAKESYANEWAGGQFGDKTVIERLNNPSDTAPKQSGNVIKYDASGKRIQ